MTYGVYALGASMLVVGLIFISRGVPIVRMELGWTEIMGGAVVASAGCIVLVMGVLLEHLEAMRDAMERLALPLPAAPPQLGVLRSSFVDKAEAPVGIRPVHPLAPASHRDRLVEDDETVRPEPALPAALHPAEAGETVVQAAIEPEVAQPVLIQSAPALVFAEEEEAAQSPAVTAPDPVADPLPEAPTPPIRANFLAAFLARRASTADPAPDEAPAMSLGADKPASLADSRPAIPSRRTSIDLSSGWEDEPAEPAPVVIASEAVERIDPLPPGLVDPASETAERVEPSSVEPAPADHRRSSDRADEGEPDPLQPVVVGRYNAGAASYVMYSNGMIEVETEQGTHQFASMQDLKSFIERRDAQVS